MPHLNAPRMFSTLEGFDSWKDLDPKTFLQSWASHGDADMTDLDNDCSQSSDASLLTAARCRWDSPDRPQDAAQEACTGHALLSGAEPSRCA